MLNQACEDELEEGDGFTWHHPERRQMGEEAGPGWAVNYESGLQLGKESF